MGGVRVALVLVGALVIAPLSARAVEVVSRAPDKVAVTVYRDRPVSTWDLVHRPAGVPAGGLALITETRTVTLPAGPVTLRFEGVSDQIVPQTVAVEGLRAALRERNFDYDLMSPGALIAKSLNQEVELVDTDRKTGKLAERRAILRSGPHGVMLEVDGRYEAFKCDSVPERMVFERIPDGLTGKPALSLRLDSPKAGRRRIKLSYLTTGLNWSADYVARVRPDGRTLDLEGWITLANGAAVSFRNAPTQVIAGRVALTGDDRPVAIAPIVRRDECWSRNPPWSAPDNVATVQEVVLTGSRGRVAAYAVAQPPAPMAIPAPPPPPMAKEEDFGDYKLYTLPEPTTVAASQTKQVRFLSKAAVPFERVYRYAVRPGDPDPGPHAPDIVLKLENTAAGGLGLPLPAGSVTVREPDAAGGLLFAGAAKVEDTPKGLPVKLTIGQAPTVSVSQRVAAVEVIGGRRAAYEISVVNPLPTAVTVEVVHPAGGRAVTIASASRPYALDAGDPSWTLTVPPGGREALTYSVDDVAGVSPLPGLRTFPKTRPVS